MCGYKHIGMSAQRPEKGIMCPVLSFSTLFPWDGISHWSRARLVASKPEWTSCLCFLQHRVCGYVCSHWWLFMWVLGIKIHILMLAWQMFLFSVLFSKPLLSGYFNLFFHHKPWGHWHFRLDEHGHCLFHSLRNHLCMSFRHQLGFHLLGSLPCHSVILGEDSQINTLISPAYFSSLRKHLQNIIPCVPCCFCWCLLSSPWKLLAVQLCFSPRRYNLSWPGLY